MRLNPEFAAVPVLLVTAAYGAQASAERIGASAWLGKPFELDRLVELIGELTDAPAPFTKTPGDGQAVLFPSAFEA
jgi:CheY-like chemotaxis protein